jgi:hypothetical protein
MNTIFRITIAFFLLANTAKAQIETLHSDEAIAKVIGNQKSYTFVKVGDKGDNVAEIKASACLPETNFETHATWLKLFISEKGKLAFDITPLQTEDDFDFIVFKIAANGEHQEVRCMATGETIGAAKPIGQCHGVTGLSLFAKDNSETKGCANNKDNFLSAVEVQAGEQYSICINNFANNNGFSIAFTGTAAFADTEQFTATFSACSPSPTKSSTKIDILIQTAGELDYTLIAANGQILYKRNTLLQKGANVLETETETLPTGAYKLLLQYQGQQIERNFVKQ